MILRHFFPTKTRFNNWESLTKLTISTLDSRTDFTLRILATLFPSLEAASAELTRVVNKFRWLDTSSDECFQQTQCFWLLRKILSQGLRVKISPELRKLDRVSLLIWLISRKGGNLNFKVYYNYKILEALYYAQVKRI